MLINHWFLHWYTSTKTSIDKIQTFKNFFTNLNICNSHKVDVSTLHFLHFKWVMILYCLKQHTCIKSKLWILRLLNVNRLDQLVLVIWSPYQLIGYQLWSLIKQFLVYWLPCVCDGPARPFISLGGCLWQWRSILIFSMKDTLLSNSVTQYSFNISSSFIRKFLYFS